MHEQKNAQSRPIIGPDGELLTLATLPDAGTERWVIRRKAQVVTAVRGGLLTIEQACERYNLSLEEFESWTKAIDRHGMQGLRTTQIKKYRETQA